MKINDNDSKERCAPYSISIVVKGKNHGLYASNDPTLATWTDQGVVQIGNMNILKPTPIIF
jgi:hypothetical protein